MASLLISAGIRRVRAAVFLCFLGTGVLGLAQEPADGDLTNLSIEELAHVKISSASRYLEDARKAPSAVTVITADEIARYGWRTLAEVLRSARGFYTAYDRHYTYLGLQGFLQTGDYNARILLLINGHRVNENLYDSALLGTEFPLDLDLIDRIEIVRGPGSSLYGTNAVLGVVNVITRQASGPATVEVSGETLSYLGRAGRLTGTLQKGRLSGVMSGSLFESAGHSKLFYPEFAAPETNNGWAEDVDGDRYAQGFADIQYGNLRVQGLYSSRLKVIPTGSYGSNFNDPDDRTTNTRGYVDATYSWKLAANTDLHLRGYYDTYRLWGTFAYGGADPATRSLLISEAAADWGGLEIVLEHRLGRHRLVAGASSEYNFRIDQKYYYPGQPTFLSDHANPWLMAPFGEMELNLTPKLTVNAGGRMDWYSTFGTALSPRFALMYFPNSRTSLKYIYSQAFRAPDAYDIYFSNNLDPTKPSQTLTPEDIHSHMVVFERGLTSWLGVTVDGFHNRLDQVIENQPDASGNPDYVNAGIDRGKGVELEVDAKRASGWAARASYTLADTQDGVSKTVSENSPRQLAKLHAAIPVYGRAFAGLELLYTDAQQNYQGVRIASSLLTNVTVSTKPLWGGWKFSASCYNAFDRRWATPTGPEVIQSAVPQDGRSYRFKVTYTRRIERERSKH
ncbi:MAG TPA: TonB-dependent receptor [Terriglobales bacterium]|nr:TonB-dependent receptor [Terriglobales bacterium]